MIFSSHRPLKFFDEVFNILKEYRNTLPYEGVIMEVITIANNKGGVGKTMQAFQLATYLANRGHQVLAIDLDSQANLSSTLGVNIQRTLIPEWLIGDVNTDQVILPSDGKAKLFDSLWVIPSSRHLANMSKLLILSEGEVRKRAGRKERLIKLRLGELTQKFDYMSSTLLPC